MFEKTLNQWDVLDHVNTQKKYVTTKQISEKLLISRSSVARMVKQLNKFGFIKIKMLGYGQTEYIKKL